VSQAGAPWSAGHKLFAGGSVKCIPSVDSARNVQHRSTSSKMKGMLRPTSWKGTGCKRSCRTLLKNNGHTSRTDWCFNSRAAAPAADPWKELETKNDETEKKTPQFCQRNVARPNQEEEEKMIYDKSCSNKCGRGQKKSRGLFT